MPPTPTSFKLNTGASIPALGLGPPSPPPPLPSRPTNPTRNLAIGARRSRNRRPPRHPRRLPAHRHSILLPERRGSGTGDPRRAGKRGGPAGGAIRDDEAVVHVPLARRGGAGGQSAELGTRVSGPVPRALAVGDESAWFVDFLALPRVVSIAGMGPG